MAQVSSDREPSVRAARVETSTGGDDFSIGLDRDGVRGGETAADRRPDESVVPEAYVSRSVFSISSEDEPTTLNGAGTSRHDATVRSQRHRLDLSYSPNLRRHHAPRPEAGVKRAVG